MVSHAALKFTFRSCFVYGNKYMKLKLCLREWVAIQKLQSEERLIDGCLLTVQYQIFLHIQYENKLIIYTKGFLSKVCLKSRMGGKYGLQIEKTKNVAW